MLDKIHLYISIIAALVVTVVSILEKATLSVLAFRLIVVIVLFYIIGVFVREYLKKNVFVEDEPIEEEVPEEGQLDNAMLGAASDDDYSDESKL